MRATLWVAGLRYEPPSGSTDDWDTRRPPFGSASLGVSAGRIIAHGRRVKAWGLDASFPNTAAEPPHSPIPGCRVEKHTGKMANDEGECSGEVEELLLVPFGEYKAWIREPSIL